MHPKITFAALSLAACAATPNASAAALSDEGIRFICRPQQVVRIKHDMASYLASLGVARSDVIERVDSPTGIVVYTLNTPQDDTDTIHLRERTRYNIKPDLVRLPARNGDESDVEVVSKKEILLALLQHGRLTEFRGDSCKVAALKDHVGVRQNIAAWASNLSWDWPDGGAAAWNKKYWDRGTPVAGHPLHEAVNDAFINQSAYSIGCYTATKLVFVQGVLDYYARVKKDAAALARVEKRLMSDGEPLVDVEPPYMWNFEDDYDASEATKPGKLLAIQYGVAPNNFVPGDWSYFLNTDPITYEKTGYEGSNAVYLGGGRFDDYYNDNDHSYTYRQKLDEVYQWRHGVFSRSRDKARIRPLSEKGFTRMQMTPADGGLQWDYRAYPYTGG